MPNVTKYYVSLSQYFSSTETTIFLDILQSVFPLTNLFSSCYRLSMRFDYIDFRMFFFFIIQEYVTSSNSK